MVVLNLINKIRRNKKKRTQKKTWGQVSQNLRAKQPIKQTVYHSRCHKKKTEKREKIHLQLRLTSHMAKKERSWLQTKGKKVDCQRKHGYSLANTLKRDIDKKQEIPLLKEGMQSPPRAGSEPRTKPRHLHYSICHFSRIWS